MAHRERTRWQGPSEDFAEDHSPWETLLRKEPSSNDFEPHDGIEKIRPKLFCHLAHDLNLPSGRDQPPLEISRKLLGPGHGVARSPAGETFVRVERHRVADPLDVILNFPSVFNGEMRRSFLPNV